MMLLARSAVACNDVRIVVEVLEEEWVVESWYRRYCRRVRQRQWHWVSWEQQKQVTPGLWQELSLAGGRKARATIQAVVLVGWMRV
jgi:hypothetical protein